MFFRSATFFLKCTDPNTYSTCQPDEITLTKGIYYFDCYGASGGNSQRATGGYGAQVSAIAHIRQRTTLYIYVGGKGEDADLQSTLKKNGGFNGGGKGGSTFRFDNQDAETGAGGGGSTDIRLTSGSWDDLESLNSRIIVAAAGGGAGHVFNGGSGGSLVGYASESGSEASISFGGNQTEEHFGFGEDGMSKTIYGNDGLQGNGGSGSGWYGGSASRSQGDNSNSAGSGGSSYVSGYEGMKVNPKFQFVGITIRDGKQTKHIGNGLVTIVRLSVLTCKVGTKSTFLPLFVLNFIS